MLYFVVISDISSGLPANAVVDERLRSVTFVAGNSVRVL